MYSNSDDQANKPLLTGTRLRSYAFALLTRKEYAKAELIEKLSLYAQDRDEVLALVEELSERQYQSDQRVAEMVLSSQIRKGKGPNRIKQALKHKPARDSSSLDYPAIHHLMELISFLPQSQVKDIDVKTA